MAETRIAAAALAILVAVCPAVLAAQIDPQTTLRVAVGRWDPVAETYTAWPDLGGEYRVGPDGVLSLPMAGEIAVGDRDTASLGTEIAERLGTRMGLAGQVSAAVTVVAVEPVYVVGGVREAGAYAHGPRLTVLKAVSLAGGMRGTEAAFLGGERGALGAMGEYRVLELTLLRDLATLARLEAELADADRIEPPEEVAQAPLGETLMDQERAIREAREAALQSSLRQIDDLEVLLRDRIDRIDAQIALRDRQLELAREELDSAATLVERGLSVESRRMAMEQRVADQEVRRLELETARLNAEQRLNELGRERTDLVNERRKALVQEIGALRLETEKLRVRMETQAALYADSLRLGDGFVSTERAEPRYEITRRGGDGVARIAADEDTLLRPGDVLRVTLPGPGTVVPAESAGPGTGMAVPSSLSLEPDVSE